MQGRSMPWCLVPSLDDVNASHAPSVSSSSQAPEDQVVQGEVGFHAKQSQQRPRLIRSCAAAI